MKVEFLPNPEKGKTPIAVARPESPQEALLAQIWLDLVQNPDNTLFIKTNFEDDGALRDLQVFVNDEPGIEEPIINPPADDVVADNIPF